MVKKIAVGMSGGVDSSVAAYILKKEGHDVFGCNLKMYVPGNGGDSGDVKDAEAVCGFLGIDFGVSDCSCRFDGTVIKNFTDTYFEGRTPNPCIVCNDYVKFAVLYETAKKEGFDKIATGHYATTTDVNGTVFLSTAKDHVKDQTYFLGQINYMQVSKLMFPIGHMLKSEVRKVASEAGLPSAERKDSQGICFLGKIHYNDFIKRYLGEKEGKIVEFETGKVLGSHKGYWFHTIGQRKGLGLGEGPWFVIKKDVGENVLYVSRGYDTQNQYGNVVNLSAFQYISKDIWGDFDELDVKFKIRHTPQFTQGKLTRIGDMFHIESEDKIQGIASGQFGVIYDNDAKLCIGSGVII